MSKKADIALGELLPELRAVAYNINPDRNKADDAVSMVIESMLKMDRELLQDIHDKGGLKWYAIRAITLNLKSSTSRYYYKYKKYYEKVDTNISNSTYSVHYYENNPNVYLDNDDDINLEAIDNLLQDLYWYDSKLFITYYKGGYTLDSLSKKTGISRMSIFNTIKKVKKYLKDNVNEKANKIRESKEFY